MSNILMAIMHYKTQKNTKKYYKPPKYIAPQAPALELPTAEQRNSTEHHGQKSAPQTAQSTTGRTEHHGQNRAPRTEQSTTDRTESDRTEHNHTHRTIHTENRAPRTEQNQTESDTITRTEQNHSHRQTTTDSTESDRPTE